MSVLRVVCGRRTARSSHVAGMQVANPDSPLARLPRSTIVDVRMKGVSPLGPNSALVRFETRHRDAGGQDTGSPCHETPLWNMAISYAVSRKSSSFYHYA